MNIDDLFEVKPLTDSITKLPVAPGLVGSLGLFAEKGIRTTTVTVEVQHGRLKLVPDTNRLAEPTLRAGTNRQLVTFRAAHLPAADVVLPEDIQNVRAFGSESVEAGLQSQATVINDKLAALKADIEATREFHRLGALRGQVLDADGSTVLRDIYSEFGVTKNAASIAFSNTSTNVLQAVLNAKRTIEKNTGGLQLRGIKALCSAGFFDALVGNAKVQKAYENWQAAQDRIGGDLRSGFTYGGVTFIECPDEVNGIAFIPDGKAQVFPDAQGIFVTYNAPANYNEAANTIGQPYYAKAEQRKMGKGWDLEAQSNPLTLCLYPEALIELTAA
ncbi:MAG: major capsid protein [Azoarcus sp.]|jgi:hypothetical protein|nr:major capsid protein [Azoarcus sp.]